MTGLVLIQPFAIKKLVLNHKIVSSIHEIVWMNRGQFWSPEMDFGLPSLSKTHMNSIAMNIWAGEDDLAQGFKFLFSKIFCCPYLTNHNCRIVTISYLSLMKLLNMALMLEDQMKLKLFQL